MPDKLFLGVDVSKDWIDVAAHGEAETHRIRQERDAIAGWLATFDPAAVLFNSLPPGRAFGPTRGSRGAIRHNPLMRDFYRRLTTVNRRPGRVALLAVMRKVLVSLDAIACDGQPWKGAAVARAA